MNCSGTGYRPTENMPLGVKLPCVAATANGVVRINRFASWLEFILLCNGRWNVTSSKIIKASTVQFYAADAAQVHHGYYKLHCTHFQILLQIWSAKSAKYTNNYVEPGSSLVDIKWVSYCMLHYIAVYLTDQIWGSCMQTQDVFCAWLCSHCRDVSSIQILWHPGIWTRSELSLSSELAGKFAASLSQK